MSSAPVTGRAPSEKDPLLRLAQSLPEAENRESYAALVSYIHSLQPTDELAKVAQLFGFLTLMGYQLPEAIEKERGKLQKYLTDAYEKLQQEVKTNASYHAQLNARLSQLPGEIADGVNPEAIAQAMSESFRQQLLKTGLHVTQQLLAGSVGDLKKTTQALDNAVEPIARRYNDLAYAVEKRAANLDIQNNNLARTADMIQKKNAELVAEVRSLSWMMLLAVGLLILLVGVFGGVTWEQRNVGSLVVDLQSQISQLQQDLKAPAATSAKPGGEHLKKK
ncbi:MAG: hypothetical protein M3Y72_03625 [Acidobacteriota bacterium]|nr:hypothetical protein [Acidobacteriota bacterium]